MDLDLRNLEEMMVDDGYIAEYAGKNDEQKGRRLDRSRPPANADPRTEDDPPLPPTTWLTIVERLVEQWGWGYTIAFLTIIIFFSLV
ncbi:AMP-dependent synthetase/ligase [Penicillium freii]|nr:AMP-dependent synthetase/ligase [Penicillium freii]